jgi:hypothetical protein
MADRQIGPVHAQQLIQPDVPGHELVRTALLHLAALDFLQGEAEQRRVLFVSSTAVRLVRRPGRGSLPAELAPVLEALFPPAKPAASLSRTEAVHRLQQRFGYDYGKYRAQHVRPALVERGWLVEEAYRTLGVIRRRRFVRTAEGERVKQEIETLLQSAADAAALITSAPRRAVELVAALGPLALISEPLRPHLPALARAARADAAAAGWMAWELADQEDRRAEWLESMGMLAEIDWTEILDALDGFGDGGADGGGDGGGE